MTYRELGASRLQASASFKKATMVGERMGGGGNICDLVRLSDHFVINLPVCQSVVPVTNMIREEAGALPDLEVSPYKALERAHSSSIKGIV